ncbi:MAG TPA: tetratricopeptide repeat protein [Asticcacaulis sp.]|nr:tetratricopeptide repeat protein [Asticcacaulis sp.]
MSPLKIRLAVTISTAALLAASAYAGDKLQQGPAPDWVEPVALPKTASAPEGAPIAVLASDVQTRFTLQSSAFYTDIALRIQTAQGLPAGQFALAWDPATDDVTIHSFHILRGDQVIDVLAHQNFTVVRRETNLDRAMLDGVLTGVLQPEGLQVGDIITYSYTLTRHIPELGAHAEGLLTDGMPDLPVGHYLRRAVWDASLPMRWKTTDDLGDLKASQKGGQKEVRFEASDYTPPKAVDQAPLRDQMFSQLQFSNYASWSEVSATIAPLYDKAAKLASDSPLRAELDKIRAAGSDPETQAAAALKLVENDVRYVYLGMNESGVVPADADATWTRRFGDCKGKTALLLALLHELGIKAEPALVSTTIGDGMDQRQPMAEYFDHVIVRAEIGGKTYWLDGTRYGDQRLSDLRTPDYHWALPLRGAGAELVAMTPEPLDKPASEESLALDASAGLDLPAKVHGERLYRGDFAVQLDSSISGMTPEDRDKALKSSWTDDYNWLTPNSVSVVFDPDKREERLVVDGVAKMDWDASNGYGRRYEGDNYGLGWTSDLKRDPGPHQNDPVALNYPYYSVWRETVTLPDHGKGFSLTGAPLDATLYGKAFHRALSLKDGVFSVEASMRALTSEIPYVQAVKDQPAVTAIAKSGVYIIAPFAYKATKAEVDASKPVSGDAQAHADAASKLMAQQRFDAALAEMDAAIKLKPDDADLLLQRGGLRVMLRDFNDALADFDAVLKIDPTRWEALNGRGQALLQLKRPADAIEAYSQSLELHSDNQWARSGRISAYAANKQPDKALADAQMFARLQPDLVSAQWALAVSLMATGHYEQALDAYRKALALTPDNVALMTEVADRLTPCYTTSREDCDKQHVEALALYDKVIAAQPSPYAYTARSQVRPYDQFELRKKDIDAALAMAPDSGFAMSARASIYFNHKDYDLAIADATHVIEHPDPDFDDSQARRIRALAYEQEKKLDLALADWDALCAASPDDAQPLNNRAWLRATHNLDLDKALADADAALKLSPDTAAFLDTRAFIELRMGRLDVALSDYDAALKQAPDLAASLYGRGLVKGRLGQKTAGDADLAAARKVYSGIDKNFADYGVTP